MLKTKRLGVRLILSYAVLLGIFILVLSLAISQIHKLTGLSARLAGKDMQTLLMVQQLSGATENVSRVLLQLLTVERTQRVMEYQAVDQKNQQIDQLLKDLENTLADTTQRQLLLNLREKRNVYQSHFLDNVNLLEDEGQEKAKAYFIQRVQPALQDLLQASNSFLVGQQTHLLQLQQSTQQEIEQISRLLILFSALALLLAIAFAWLFTRSIARPLEALKLNAQHIASGNYQDARVNSEIDEIRQVAEALSSMSHTIAEREQAIQQLAFYDSLTGLANRTLLQQSFNQAAYPQTGLIIMDLARLKIINATLGFDTGDTIIAQVAGRLRKQFPAFAAQHQLARLSGGSFALLLPEQSQQQVLEIHSELAHLMEQPVACSGHLVDINWITGLCYSAQHEWKLSQLLRNAEIALHTAKRSAQHFAMYSDAQEASRLSHLSLLSDLRLAVKYNQLQLWLQPKLKLSDGKTYGFEALVRWQHPQRGFISPAEFIPFAEQTGYIGLITNWMLEQALSTLKDWHGQGKHFSIAVNISTHDLRNSDFDKLLLGLLQRYQIPAELLRLEITESGLMEDPAASLLLLEKLKNLGLSLSIDDFGTGYSSLAYLQKLPVNELKIDRSFVTHLDGNARLQKLVGAIVKMGQSLDLSVIAEGIERQEEKQILQSLGCDAMQGYLASKPLHGEALQAWLQHCD